MRNLLRRGAWDAPASAHDRRMLLAVAAVLAAVRAACPAGQTMVSAGICAVTCVTSSDCGLNATCVGVSYCQCNLGYISRSVSGSDGTNCFNYDCTAVPASINGSVQAWQDVARPLCTVPGSGVTWYSLYQGRFASISLSNAVFLDALPALTFLGMTAGLLQYVPARLLLHVQPGLRTVDLSANAITMLDDTLFQGHPWIQTMCDVRWTPASHPRRSSLAYNLLTGVSAALFRYSFGLQRLDLRINAITRVDDSAFDNTPFLSEL